MDSNVTSESLSSNDLSLAPETLSGQLKHLDTRKKKLSSTSCQHASDTRHGESGEPDTSWKKRANKTATVTPTGGHNLLGRSHATRVGSPSESNGSPRNSPDSCSGEAADTQQIELKSNPDSFYEGSTWKQRCGENLGLDPTSSLPVRQAPRKRESPLKRKNPDTSHEMGNEQSKDSLFTVTKHPTTRWTRRRLVDSLCSSEDSRVPQDNSQIPLHPGTHIRQRRSTSESNICAGENISFAETSRQPHSTSSMLRGSRVTYARQRSFLNDNSFLNGLKDGDLVTPSENHGLSSSRPSALHSQLMHGFEDDEDDEKSDSKPVRSIHELRQAGENARFRETVELILEDIECSSNSDSERCDGYIRLCSKLLKTEFVRQFCEYGFEQRILEITTESIDIISASLTLCAYSMIFNSGFFSFALSARFWWKIMQITPRLLHSDTNFLCLVDQQPPTSITKAVRHSLRKNLPDILSSVCGKQPSNTSPCFLGLYGINIFLQNHRQKVRSVAPISTPLLSQLIWLLVAKDEADEGATQKFELLVFGLSILDSYTVLSSEHWDHTQCNSLAMLSRLRWLLYPNQIDQDRKLLGLYIRVIMNITNADPSLCKEIATFELVAGLVGIVTKEFCHVPEDSLAKENSTLNIVILALGALTNLAEKNESSRAVFLMPGRNSTTFFQLLLQQFAFGIDSLGKVRQKKDRALYNCQGLLI